MTPAASRRSQLIMLNPRPPAVHRAANQALPRRGDAAAHYAGDDGRVGVPGSARTRVRPSTAAIPKPLLTIFTCTVVRIMETRR